MLLRSIVLFLALIKCRRTGQESSDFIFRFRSNNSELNNMNEIRQLSKNTIDHIAAGEVVEGPSSVVKELTENAIDAGAKHISIDYKDGGTTSIRISDDGCGIPADEVKIAFLPHATSKLREISDLDDISTLGFRGEALSSIAAVSKVEMLTKTEDELIGAHFEIDGGEEEAFTEMACPKGTTIIVKNLFYNTPARRKFLKSSMTEGNYIDELLQNLSLSHPDISFTVTGQGRERIFTSGNGKLSDTIYQVMGKDTARNLYELEFSNEFCTISGFLGQPVIHRGNRNREIFFVNGRYIKSKIISKAVEDAYQGYLMLHQYPLAILNIDFHGAFVDVNVHPRKTEVRFSDNEKVYEVLFEAVRNRLKKAEDVQDVILSEETAAKVDTNTGEVLETNQNDANALNNQQSAAAESTSSIGSTKSAAIINNTITSKKSELPPSFLESNRFEQYKQKTESAIQSDEYYAGRYENTATLNEQSEVQINTPASKFSSEKPEQLSFFTADDLKQHRIIGQVFKTYWLVEFDDRLYIIDQHAAHEKVLYEHTMKKLKEKTMTSQQISPPIIVSLSPNEIEIYEKYKDAYKELGYEIDSFGGKDYSISAVPANMYSIDPKELFLSSLNDLEFSNDKVTNDILLIRVATMSCKAAIKGNTEISEEEARALIEELFTLDNPFHCPHGRPTMIEISHYEMDKRFKRIVD